MYDFVLNKLDILATKGDIVNIIWSLWVSTTSKRNDYSVRNIFARATRGIRERSDWRWIFRRLL